MKEMIQYNYNINNFEINVVGNRYLLLYKNEVYVLEKVTDVDMLNEVLIYKNMYPMYEVIYTIFDNIFLEYYNEKYVLYKVTYPNKIINSNFLFPILYTKNVNNNVKIWENNIEYFKNEIVKLYYENSNLVDNINYYIGMAENAIYLYCLGDKMDDNARVTLSHYRIFIPNVNLSYLNPNNLVVDYMTRDVAEYIKSLYFKDKINLEMCIRLINKYNFNYRELYYLFSRLLYPMKTTRFEIVVSWL